MKKLIAIIAISGLLFAATFSASAVETPVIILKSKQVPVNVSEFSLDLYAENMPRLTNLCVDLYELPIGIEFVGIESHLTSLKFATGNPTLNPLDIFPYYIAWQTETGNGGDVNGKIATLHFRFTAQTEPGETYEISIAEHEGGTVEDTEILDLLSYTAVLSEVTVIPTPLKGDTDGDNIITALDAYNLLVLLAGNYSETEDDVWRYDITGDGRVDIKDALAILKIAINN